MLYTVIFCTCFYTTGVATKPVSLDAIVPYIFLVKLLTKRPWTFVEVERPWTFVATSMDVCWNVHAVIAIKQPMVGYTTAHGSLCAQLLPWATRPLCGFLCAQLLQSFEHSDSNDHGLLCTAACGFQRAQLKVSNQRSTTIH